jgi:hypothetical protein
MIAGPGQADVDAGDDAAGGLLSVVGHLGWAGVLRGGAGGSGRGRPARQIGPGMSQFKPKNSIGASSFSPDCSRIASVEFKSKS